MSLLTIADRAGSDFPAERRHPEWREHRVRWKWLLDSLEGGERYRQASYGTDSRGLPVRNLIRHKREYPDPRELQNNGAYGVSNVYGNNPVGTDPAIKATDDDYELRRARTPVPTFVPEAITRDVSKVFGRKPTRAFPASGLEDLEEWSEDVDGKGTSLADWLEQEVAPIFLACGQVDLLFDHPAKPEGEDVRTLADEARLGLGRCVASIVLPENVVWWRLDASGARYEEVVVLERIVGDDGKESCRYRHWTRAGWTLYGDDQRTKADEGSHAFGVVPIVRVFDRRKARCEHVGQSRYEAIAERQREYYNRDSELILSDTTQAHPLLQGPEDFIQGDGTIPIGPAWLLPKKKNQAGGTATYEGFDVVDFPKGAADSIRQNKAEIRDDVDRDAGMTKPAGASGTGRSTVAQSGVSKQLDAIDGNDRLATIAKSLAKVERACLAYALAVLRDDPAAMALAKAVDVAYPAVFALSDLTEMGTGLESFQALLSASGESPELETLALQQMARKLLPGYPDAVFATIDDEIREAVLANAERKAQLAEAMPALPTPGEVAVPGGIDPADDEQPDESQGDPPATDSKDA